MRKRTLFAAAAIASSLAVVAPMAQADPVGPPTFRDLAGVGSDTTQDVLNALSDVVTINGTKVIASYNASGSPAQVQTKSNAACVYNRSDIVGSNAGVGKLQDSLENVANQQGCLDFARSSSNNSASFPSNPPGGPGRLSYVPFAVDALTFVIRDDSPLPNTLTVADLRSIYDCQLPTTDVKPVIPQAGSGTRNFFLQQLGYTATEISNFNATTHPCVTFNDATGTPILENTGTLLTDPLNVAPYSVAQYQSQINRTIADVHGRTILGQVDGKNATQLSTDATMKRDVYNVIPFSKEGVAPWSTTFVGPTSVVCTNTATITKLGFGPASNCGVITIRTS
jgi:ABC-type phosphate transport system substrate-binding protein